MTIDGFVTGVIMTATAATGGISAGEGKTVVTGDSSASVQVANVINAGTSGGTSHTEVVKTVDGVTSKTTEDKTYPPGEPVVVETSVEAVSSGSVTESAVKSDVAVYEAAGAASTSEEAGEKHSNTLFEKITTFLRSVFGLLGF